MPDSSTCTVNTPIEPVSELGLATTSSHAEQIQYAADAMQPFDTAMSCFPLPRASKMRFASSGVPCTLPPGESQSMTIADTSGSRIAASNSSANRSADVPPHIAIIMSMRCAIDAVQRKHGDGAAGLSCRLERTAARDRAPPPARHPASRCSAENEPRACTSSARAARDRFSAFDGPGLRFHEVAQGGELEARDGGCRRMSSVLVQPTAASRRAPGGGWSQESRCLRCCRRSPAVAHPGAAALALHGDADVDAVLSA
jgi:hypothetical protein